MAAKQQSLHEVLPKAGLVYSEKGNLSEVLCKPKIMPIKSVTLQQLESIEKQAVAIGQQRAQTAAAERAGMRWVAARPIRHLHSQLLAGLFQGRAEPFGRTRGAAGQW
eukprot:tig00020912_g15864.t1